MDFTHTSLPIEEKLPKLVRDKIIQQIRENNKIEPEFHTASETEYRQFLLNKLVEESTEAQACNERQELIKELADLKELTLSLMDVEKITEADIEAVRELKKLKNGGFEHRIILDRK